MFNILNIFLVLALLSTITATVLAQQPSGPEGPIGVWILLLIPWLFAVILTFVMAGKGLLDFIPGGGLIQFVIVVGILFTFTIAIFGTIDRHNDNLVIQGLVITVPCLILLCSAVIIHQTAFQNLRLVYWAALILLGTAALSGWGLAGTGIYIYMQGELERSAQQAQKESDQEEQNMQWWAVEYAKLDESASLYSFLGFIWSQNDEVRQQAQEKVSRFPGLDDKLIELLDLDSKEAISYIAKLYENPPAKFAPAWGRMLKRQLKKWDSLQYDEHAGNWELNLKVYFEGARKIQLAGGSLHDELLPWYTYLQKCKGLGNLAAFVKTLLETKSKS